MQKLLFAICLWFHSLVLSFFFFYVKDSDAVQRGLEQVILGIFSISVEGGDATVPPAYVGIVIEGVEVLHDLGDISSACALLMGVYMHWTSAELKAFSEVLQKLFL